MISSSLLMGVAVASASPISRTGSLFGEAPREVGLSSVSMASNVLGLWLPHPASPPSEFASVPGTAGTKVSSRLLHCLSSVTPASSSASGLGW
jgi:hypothetical protein